MANNASPANTEINPKYLTYPFIEYKSTKNIWLLHKKTVLLHRILQNNNYLITIKYESIRNRFHFDSRFV